MHTAQEKRSYESGGSASWPHCVTGPNPRPPPAAAAARCFCLWCCARFMAAAAAASFSLSRYRKRIDTCSPRSRFPGGQCARQYASSASPAGYSSRSSPPPRKLRSVTDMDTYAPRNHAQSRWKRAEQPAWPQRSVKPRLWPQIPH